MFGIPSFGGNKAKPKNPIEQGISFRNQNEAMFKLLREKIQSSAVAFEKKDLIENATSLDELTERVARAIQKQEGSIREDVLNSPLFGEILKKALEVTPAPQGYISVTPDGTIVGREETKKEIIQANTKHQQSSH